MRLRECDDWRGAVLVVRVECDCVRACACCACVDDSLVKVRYVRPVSLCVRVRERVRVAASRLPICIRDRAVTAGAVEPSFKRARVGWCHYLWHYAVGPLQCSPTSPKYQRLCWGIIACSSSSDARRSSRHSIARCACFRVLVGLYVW